MASPVELCYKKRGNILVKNLKARHFDAYYCNNCEEGLKKTLELIPFGSSVGWGGALSAVQIGLLDAMRTGDYLVIDRDACNSPTEREKAARDCFFADYFIAGANAISLDGQMVNVDGNGNRVAAISYGPKNVIIIAGMNKVVDTLESAVVRARSIAAPRNQQRFLRDNPCTETGCCFDCKSASCICNQILITRHCNPYERIKFVLIGEDLGL